MRSWVFHGKGAPLNTMPLLRLRSPYSALVALCLKSLLTFTSSSSSAQPLNTGPSLIVQFPSSAAKWSMFPVFVGSANAAIWTTASPPAAWREIDYDDTNWNRGRGALLPGTGSTAGATGHGQGENRAVEAFYLRSYFHVDDPASLRNLQITARFRGGIIIWINGQEVARSFIARNAPAAEPYPPAAFSITVRDFADKAPEAATSRLRSLNATQVPAETVNRGLNVIAVEVRRAGLPESKISEGGDAWAMVGLQDLELSTGAPQVFPVEKVRICNADPLDAVIESDQMLRSPMPLRPMRIVAPKGGSGSAQIVVVGDTALTGVTAHLRELRGERGNRLPDKCGRVRFATTKTQAMSFSAPYFDALDETPSPNGRIQPVWVTIDVPIDSNPGRYNGDLEVVASGKAFIVPVEINVSDWRFPSREERRVFSSFLQSPESVAWQYKVPMWSDAHWRLLEQSFAFMGQLDGRTLMIPVLDQSHLWTEHGMIPLRKSGDSFEPDFSTFDRYVDLFAKHVGEPARLALYVWDMDLNTIEAGRATEIVLTEITPQGILRPVALPMCGAPGTRELWTKIMSGVRDRVKRRGWDERCITIGVASDGRPDKRTIEFFSEIAPYAQWSIFTHGRGDPRPKARRLILNGGMSVGWEELVKVSDRDQSEYQPASRARDAALGDWIEPENRYRFLLTWSTRFYMFEYSELQMWRAMPDSVVRAGVAGFTRIGLDYWPVRAPGSAGIERILVNDEWNLDNPRSILSPGLTGPIATVRFEMLREGLQEAEARIALEIASQRGTLPPAVAERFARLQKERTIFRDYGAIGHKWTVGPGWQARVSELYSLASQIGASNKSK